MGRRHRGPERRTWPWVWTCYFSHGLICLAFFAWQFFLFLCKEREKWGALVADEVKRALRRAGFITFGRWVVWCGFTSYLQSLSRNLGSVLPWVLLVGLYTFKRRERKSKRRRGILKANSWREQRTPSASSGVRRDRAEDDGRHGKIAFLSRIELVEFACLSHSPCR